MVGTLRRTELDRGRSEVGDRKVGRWFGGTVRLRMATECEMTVSPPLGDAEEPLATNLELGGGRRPSWRQDWRREGVVSVTGDEATQEGGGGRRPGRV